MDQDNVGLVLRVTGHSVDELPRAVAGGVLDIEDRPPLPHDLARREDEALRRREEACLAHSGAGYPDVFTFSERSRV
jgi:hypothetical protein